MVRGSSICAVVLICAVLTVSAQETGIASGKRELALRYDRVQILERFFKVVYPDLADGLAMFELDVTFEGSRSVKIGHLRFYPCVSGAGLSSGIEEPLPLLPSSPPSPTAPKPPVPPQCGIDPTPEFERFLNVSLDVSAGHKNRPISKFAASGTYIDAKLRELQKQFAGKWYPTDNEVLQALRSKNPRYGPDNKKEFLATLPLEKIRELTGCRLNPETATFIAELQDNSLHLPPDLQWHLSGKSAGSKTTCNVAFEPFDGHLTLFMD